MHMFKRRIPGMDGTITSCFIRYRQGLAFDKAVPVQKLPFRY